jgi:hypothetical protein
MRCLVCNTEMVLMEAVRADPTILPGFEHRTFLCPACHDIERRLVFAGAKAPAAASRRDLPATKLQMGRGTAPRSAWTRAVEKLVNRQKALNEQAVATRNSDRALAVEKLRSERTAAKERPAAARTTDIVSEFNRIWDGACPAADKPVEPPPTHLMQSDRTKL